MSVLLDSHVLFWAMQDSRKLSANAVRLLGDSSHRKLISPVSHWEMAIKISTNKFKLGGDFAEFWERLIKRYEILPIELRHSKLLTTLPFHHRDPFDRMLVAQCLADDLTLLSSDDVLDAYGVRRVW